MLGLLARATTRALPVLVAGASMGAGATPIRLVDVAEERGLSFSHDVGRPERLRYIVETTGSGVCVLDADGDADDDVYLVNGGLVGAAEGRSRSPSRLFLNEGGTFLDATERSGLEGRGFGMGCTAGDVDGDGDVDLLVTNAGPDELFLNDGTGRFREVGTAAGLADPRWTTSAGLADVDGDGDLDLMVAAYVDFEADGRWCKAPGGLEVICTPRAYEAIGNRLYRNDGPDSEGVPRFTDVTRQARAAGGPGKSLGLLFEDLAGDPRPDAYVANDTVRNTLLVADGTGRFVDRTLRAGVGLSESGLPEAGMGVAAGDLDGDGLLDIVVTNFRLESNTVYRGLGGGRWTDVSSASGMGAASLPMLAFGIEVVDLDLDGDLDVFVANGHVDDRVAEYERGATHAQADQVFENRSMPGRLRLVDVSRGSIEGRSRVGRGAAWLDLEGDGDIDLVVNNNVGPPHLYENRTAAVERSWLVVRLEGPAPNTRGVGALVEAAPVAPGSEAARPALRRRVRTASSFLSSSPARAHFGLGAARAARVVVRWPDGTVQDAGTLAGGRRHVVRHPSLTAPAEPAGATGAAAAPGGDAFPGDGGDDTTGGTNDDTAGGDTDGGDTTGGDTDGGDTDGGDTTGGDTTGGDTTGGDTDGGTDGEVAPNGEDASGDVAAGDDDALSRGGRAVGPVTGDGSGS